MKTELSKIAQDLEQGTITDQEARTLLLGLLGVGKSLPIKRYDIDFGGNLMAGIEIIGESISVFGAMNGYGNGVDEDRIKITER